MNTCTRFRTLSQLNLPLACVLFAPQQYCIGQVVPALKLLHIIWRLLYHMDTSTLTHPILFCFSYTGTEMPESTIFGLILNLEGILGISFFNITKILSFIYLFYHLYKSHVPSFIVYNQFE